MSRPDFLSPILLQDNAIIASNPSGTAMVQLSGTRFYNPNRTAMLVDEFRFFSGSQGAGVRQYGLYFVDIKAGSIPLTDGFVPMLGLALPYNVAYESGSSPPPVENTGLLYRLPKPLYVPPDVPISVQVRTIAGSVDLGNLLDVMQVAIACRSIPEGMPKPDTIYVPWASSYEVDPTFAGVRNRIFPVPGPSEAKSPTSRLGNPHGESLEMTKLTGTYAPNSDAPGVGGYSYPDLAIFIQATLSNGKIVIRDKVPYFDVFPMNKPWVDIRATLQPKAFITVNLSIDENFWAPGGPYDANETFNKRLRPVRIGLQGYRELERPWGAMP